MVVSVRGQPAFVQIPKIKKLPRNGAVSGDADGIVFACVGLQTPEVSLNLGFNRPAIVEASDTNWFFPPGIHKEKLRPLLTENVKSDNVPAVISRAH
jgi:hypothetical protein